jgi:SAM-dependent methyltransferase
MLDYGDVALYETIEYLDALGIKHVGAGRDYKEANRPLLMECNGKKIAFISCVFIYSASTRMATRNKPGVSDYRMHKILPVIRDLSLAGFQVNVSIHWGIEYSFFPLPYQMNQARQMIDNGASMILGHGPHYPQGIENYNGGQIVYSLGNFIFDEPHTFANKSFIFSIGVTKDNKLQDMQIFPVQLNHHVPALVHDGPKERLESLIRILSELYPKKSKIFWEKINNIYLSDIISRVLRMRSLKFLFLPSASFYFNIGFVNLLKKLRFSNFRAILGLSPKNIAALLKKMFRTFFPLGVRKRFAVWLNNRQWLSTRYYLTEGVVRDFMISNPKAFHKFMWSNHIRAYATWYDSETLFDSNKMNGSELTSREFFNDLKAVMANLGIDPTRDIRSVLEVGCSLGYVLHFIEKNIFPHSKELVGIDIDAEAIAKGTRHLRSKGSKVRLICGDMEDVDRLIGDHRFDFIYAAGVLSYLNADDAAKVVSDMLRRTNTILALVGLACTSVDNKELDASRLSSENRNQWIHNFEAMVEAAGGRVVHRRWEGDKVHNDQPLYFVFATGPNGKA